MKGGYKALKNSLFSVSVDYGDYLMGEELGVVCHFKVKHLSEAWCLPYGMPDGVNRRMWYYLMLSNLTFLYPLLCSRDIYRCLLCVRHCVRHGEASNENFTLFLQECIVYVRRPETMVTVTIGRSRCCIGWGQASVGTWNRGSHSDWGERRLQKDCGIWAEPWRSVEELRDLKQPTYSNI